MHQVLQSDLVWTHKWPFRGLSDLHLWNQKVTLKKLVGKYRIHGSVIGYSHLLFFLWFFFQAAPELAQNFLKPLGCDAEICRSGIRKISGQILFQLQGFLPTFILKSHHPPLHFTGVFCWANLIQVYCWFVCFSLTLWRTLRTKWLLPINGGEWAIVPLQVTDH